MPRSILREGSARTRPTQEEVKQRARPGGTRPDKIMNDKWWMINEWAVLIFLTEPIHQPYIVIYFVIKTFVIPELTLSVTFTR